MAERSALRGLGAPAGGRPLKLASAASTNLRTSAMGQPCGFCIARRRSDVASLLLAVIQKSMARRPLKMPLLTERNGFAPWRSRSWIVSTCACLAAMCKLLMPALSIASTSHPLRSSNSVTGTCPHPAAKCSAVRPFTCKNSS